MLILEHQSQHTTCFMINLTLKHNTTIIPFSIVENFSFTNEKIGKIGGFRLKIGENRNILKKIEKIGNGHPVIEIYSPWIAMWIASSEIISLEYP